MDMFVFVILHYCAIHSTIETIESIRRNCTDQRYKIIVVDNASPDHSGQELYSLYLSDENISVLFNSENEGFARGNNRGYRLACEKYSPDFIIILNNDVLITQADFLKRISAIYTKEHFYVMGPDIITQDKEHRSPHRKHNFSLKDINRIIRNRTIILWYLRLKKVTGLTEKIKIVERWDKKRSEQERSEIQWNIPQENVVLQGCCFIFSPDYISREVNAFCPSTFLWLEEEILSCQCGKKGYKVLYHPAIQVIHKEEVSTAETIPSSEKYYFFSKQLRRSARVMKRILRDKPTDYKR